MPTQMSKRIQWSFVLIALLLSLACFLSDPFGNSEERVEVKDDYGAIHTENALRETLAETIQAGFPADTPEPAQPDGPAATQPAATLTVGPGDEIIALTLTFNAVDMQDLPVYRATLSNPFNVYKSGSGPWVVEQSAARTDDLQALGGTEPGSVTQNSAFSGSYDPVAGTLVGLLTHHYLSHNLATETALEALATSDLSCELNLARVDGTNNLQGTCTGSLTWEYEVPGYSDYYSTTNKQVTYQVSTELPEQLLNQP